MLDIAFIFAKNRGEINNRAELSQFNNLVDNTTGIQIFNGFYLQAINSALLDPSMMISNSVPLPVVAFSITESWKVFFDNQTSLILTYHPNFEKLNDLYKATFDNSSCTFFDSQPSITNYENPFKQPCSTFANGIMQLVYYL